MGKYISNQERDRQIIEISQKQISKLINIALASSQIETLVVKEKNGDYEFRPDIHLFIYGEKGSTKSTLLKEISRKIPTIPPYTHLTFPALVGSIDKDTKQIIHGACWECKRNFLLLDEFDFNQRNKELIRALLQLMEGGVYSRKISAFSIPSDDSDGDLYFKFKSGKFDIKTRFSLILATMKYPYNSQNLELQALISRCIALPLYMDKGDLMKIAEGEPLFEYKKINVRKNIIVNRKDYEKILNYVDKNTDEGGENLLRIAGDCTRVFAVLGKHNEDLYNIIVKLGSKKFARYSKYN